MRPHPPQRKAGASYPRRKRWQRLAILLYGIILALLSLSPSSGLPKIPNWSTLFSPDKVAHFIAYAIFALLLSLELFPTYARRGIGYAIIGTAAFGALMELLQGMTGLGREADPVDMVANLLGAVLGGLLFVLARIIYTWAFPAGRA